ncbi:MAG: NUDIX domain-containing protein [Candidatus Cryptobacteroides sp.]
MFPIVKENGEVIAYASREYCHSGAKPLHPVVHLHLIDRMQRLYLQKRSMKKDIQPGKWDTAVGGHVDFGEDVYEALLRETREELGMTDYNPVYLQSYIFESEIEKELVNVFAAVGAFTPVPDKDEVDEGRWWTFEDIEENLGKTVFTPNFEQEFLRIRNSLRALL